MRFVVLIFGFFGSLLTAALGAAYFSLSDALVLLNEHEINKLPGLDQILAPLYNLSVSPGVTGLFVLVAAAFGLLGTIFSFLRCGWQGALLMLVPVAGAAVMTPPELLKITLVFSGLQIFAGLLSFLVFRKPIAPQN